MIHWGAWVAQSVKYLTSAQVTIPPSVEFKTLTGLCADSSEPGAGFKFCVSLSLCPSPAPLKSKYQLKKFFKLTDTIHWINRIKEEKLYDHLNRCRKSIWQNSTSIYNKCLNKPGIEVNFFNLKSGPLWKKVWQIAYINVKWCTLPS